MQNIQDLKDKIFSESRDIISILSGINNVDELVSKSDLVNDLAEKISFLKLLDKNTEHYRSQNTAVSEDQSAGFLYSENLITEEEAIFNNELNEIGKEDAAEENTYQPEEEEAIFNNQLNEIIESDYHEEVVNLVEDNNPEAQADFVSDEIADHLEEEAAFNNQLNEIDEEQPQNIDAVLSFVDEERILQNSEPENEDDFEEEFFSEKQSEEENSFDEQLNEISEEETKESENHIIPDIFESESNEDEILIEETESEYISSAYNSNQDELITENSNVEAILSEIKKDSETEAADEENVVKAEEESERRKIVEIDKPQTEFTRESSRSDESFENLEAYRQEKKIRLANIRGLRSIQTLFDDDPLEKEISQQPIEEPVIKEDSGSLLKNNIPTDYMEAEKQRPEFRLDLNDRLAFTKVLFGGSQTDLNAAVSELNRCKNLEEAKQFLSDLYYDKKWDRVDEYAQRLWILVENKFI